MNQEEQDGKQGVARVTLTLPRDVLASLDGAVAEGAARNRSALAAELLRCAQQHRAGRAKDAWAAGSVSMVYDTRGRGTAEGVLSVEEHAGPGVEVPSEVETGLGGGRRLRVALVRGRAGAIWSWARRLESVRGMRRVQVSLTEVGRQRATLEGREPKEKGWT